MPESFDAAVLQAARASSACQHKNLTVYSYGDTTVEKLDERFHVYTSTFTGRSLACCDCGTVLQTIDWNRTEQGKNLHTWYNFESKEKNHMYCEDCGATKVIKYPCGHKLLTFAEDGLYHCGKCDAISPSGEVVVTGLNPVTTTITATDTISGKKTTLKVTVTR